MSDDALQLIARPAVQQSTMTLVAQPAGQSVPAPTSYAPETWLDLPAPVAVDQAPRSLGRVRMPVRVLFLVVLTVVGVAGWTVLLLWTDAYEAWGWQWYFVVSLTGSNIIGLICWVVTPRWILRRHHASEVVAWRRPNRQDFTWVGVGLAVMVGLWFAYWEIIPWAGWEWALPVQPPQGSNVVVFFAWWHAALFAVLAVIVAPFVEETFFRGFMLGGLNRVWWLVPSILLSAALFSAVHFNLRVLIPFAVFGVILGIVYLRTKHLTAPAMAHAGWNLGVTVLLLMEYGVG